MVLDVYKTDTLSKERKKERIEGWKTPGEYSEQVDTRSQIIVQVSVGYSIA